MLPQACHTTGQSAIDPQLYYQFKLWQEWKEWQKWKEWQLSQQQQQPIQPGVIDKQSPESSDPQEQPSQSAIPQSYTAQNTIVATDIQDHPVTEEDHAVQETDSHLQHQRDDE